MSGLSGLVERGIRTARRLEDQARNRPMEEQAMLDERRQTRDDYDVRRRETRREEREYRRENKRQYREWRSENRERDQRAEAKRKASRFLRGQRAFQMGKSAYRARTGLTIAGTIVALQWFVVGAVVSTVLATGLLRTDAAVRSSTEEDVTNFTTLTFIGHAVGAAIGLIAVPFVRNVLTRAVSRGEEAVIRLNLVRTMGASVEPTQRTSALKAAAYENLARLMRGTARTMLIVLLVIAAATVAADVTGIVIRYTLGGDKDHLGHLLAVWNIAAVGASVSQLVVLAVTFALYRKASKEAQIAARLGEAVAQAWDIEQTGGAAADVGLATSGMDQYTDTGLAQFDPAAPREPLPGTTSFPNDDYDELDSDHVGLL